MIEREFDLKSMTNRSVWRANRLCWGDIIERPIWSFGDKIALKSYPGAYAYEENKELTYKQANDQVNRIANALLAQGLKPGDRILGLVLSNIEAALFSLAVSKAGLVLAPIIPFYAADVLDHVIQKIDPDFCFCETEIYPFVQEALQRNGVKVGMSIPTGGDGIEGSTPYIDFIKDHSTEEPEVNIQPNDITRIMFTSGTTAFPKGVMLSHLNFSWGMLSAAMTATRGLRMEWDAIGLNAYPYFHVMGQGFTFAATVTGGTSILLRTPDPVTILEAITAEKVTFTLTSPDSWYLMIDMCEKEPDKYSLSSMKVAWWGWSSFDPEYAAKFEKMAPGVILIAGDGQTEDSALDQRFPIHCWRDQYEKGSREGKNYFGIGHPMRGTTVMNITEDDLMTEPNERGEKVMRSPSAMHGYYKDEVETKKCFTKKGWLRGGDSVYKDDDGLMVFTDRIKDLIKTGGENVVSTRVEMILMQHPKIIKTAVVGLPHRRWGEAVTAFVVLNEGAELSEEEVIDFSKSRLAKFEVPKKIILVPGLPETIGGKIQKFKLKENFHKLFEGEDK